MSPVARTVPDRPAPTRLKRILIAAGAAALFLVLVGYIALGPYLTLLKLKNAVAERDADAVSECLDYPALRQNLKEQVERAIKTQVGAATPLAALAAGVAVSVADGLVDRLVTPEGLAELMAGQKPALVSATPGSSAPTGRGLLDGATYGYASLGKFVVDVPTRGGNIRFVLTRSGIGWKLSRIDIPTIG
jgi:hypothetical protein